MPPPILTLTLNPALDVTTTLERLVPQRKLRCSVPHYDAGGGGVNVSRAIRELEGQSRAFVVLGGSTGAQYRAILAASGVEHVVFEIAGETRFSLTAMEAASGQPYRFVLPGPTIGPDEAERLFAAIAAAMAEGARYVVASGSLPPGLPTDSYARIARLCRKEGRLFVIDSAGPGLAAVFDEHPYIVRLNHHEAKELVGGDDPVDSADRLAAQLIGRRAAQIVVVTIGDQGAIVTTPDRRFTIRPPHVEVGSTVGAGDSFVAALVLGLSRGWPLERAARYGVAAAASAVTGTATELCRRDDTERLLALMSA